MRKLEKRHINDILIPSLKSKNIPYPNHQILKNMSQSGKYIINSGIPPEFETVIFISVYDSLIYINLNTNFKFFLSVRIMIRT